MKKILILASKRSEKKEKLIAFLEKEFAGIAEVVLGVYPELIFEIEQGKINVEVAGHNIKDFDLVYFRNTSGFQPMATTLSIYLESANVKFFDKLITSGSFMGDKFTSLMRLAVNGLPIVPSFLCWKGALAESKNRIVEKFKFPLVAKGLDSQRMQSIYLIKSMGDFDKLPDKTKTGKDANYLFQKFIDFDKEYRVLVLGETVGSINCRTVRDNTGFKLKYLDLSELPIFLNIADVSWIIKDTAIKAAKALNIQIAGVDVCCEKETSKVYLFEVNRGPEPEYDTSISRELPKIAEFFKKELSIK